MRLWSLHPSLVDPKGLVALWREALLAKKVLANSTKGYKNHPQLIRFKNCRDPLSAINYYLSEVYKEAVRRSYNFDRSKIDWSFKKLKIKVTTGQIEYELQHLDKKIKGRSPSYKASPEKLHHPIFTIVEGEIESWEVIN